MVPPPSPPLRAAPAAAVPSSAPSCRPQRIEVGVAGLSGFAAQERSTARQWLSISRLTALARRSCGTRERQGCSTSRHSFQLRWQAVPVRDAWCQQFIQFKKIGYCGSFINKLPLPSSKFQPGCDRQEATRPGGQGGPASTEPAAAQKRITPARARGRLAARHSEALLCAAAPERARLRDRLVQLLAEARAARQESRPTLDKYVHPQLTRKVSEGLLRFHRGCAQSEHVATTRSRRRQVVGGKARRS